MALRSTTDFSTGKGGFGALLFSVTNAAQAIWAGDSHRQMAVLKNTGTQTIFIGGSDVDTSTNGYPLAAGEVLTISGENVNPAGKQLYAIVASGTANLAILEGTV